MSLAPATNAQPKAAFSLRPFTARNGRRRPLRAAVVHSMPSLLLHLKKLNTKFDNNLKITLLLILISVLILKHDMGLSCFNTSSSAVADKPARCAASRLTAIF